MTIEYKKNCVLYENFGKYFIYDNNIDKNIYIGCRTNSTIKDIRKIFDNYIEIYL